MSVAQSSWLFVHLFCANIIAFLGTRILFAPPPTKIWRVRQAPRIQLLSPPLSSITSPFHIDSSPPNIRISSYLCLSNERLRRLYLNLRGRVLGLPLLLRRRSLFKASVIAALQNARKLRERRLKRRDWRRLNVLRVSKRTFSTSYYATNRTVRKQEQRRRER
jgi:hypothetical protein